MHWLQLPIVCAGVYRLNLESLGTTKNKYAVHNIHTDKSYSNINFQIVGQIKRTIVFVFTGIIAHKKNNYLIQFQPFKLRFLSLKCCDNDPHVRYETMPFRGSANLSLFFCKCQFVKRITYADAPT